MNENSKQAAPAVRWAVTIRESSYPGAGSRYVHFTALAMILGESQADHKTGIFDPDSYELRFSQAIRALAGLKITAQADSDSMCRPGNEFYGWSVGYERHTVELRDAEDIVKVLRKIDRRMTQLTAELGRPATLAQFVTYAARAFGSVARPFVRYLSEGGNDYEGTGYRSMDPDALGSWIWSECAEWRKQYGIEAD